MKLYEIKNEDDFEKYGELIKQNCKPYLNEIGDIDSNSFILRGMRNIDKQFVEKTVRKDRDPKLTPKPIHDFIDDWFKGNYQIKIRSEGIFGTGDNRRAASYGKPYAIFPIGNFDYIWSPDIPDLTLRLEAVIAEALKQEGEKLDSQIDAFDIIKTKYNSQQKLPKQVRVAILKKLRSAKYQKNKNLKQAIKSNNEIMINCDKYYAIEAGHSQKAIKKLIDVLKE